MGAASVDPPPKAADASRSRGGRGRGSAMQVVTLHRTLPCTGATFRWPPAAVLVHADHPYLPSGVGPQRDARPDRVRVHGSVPDHEFRHRWWFTEVVGRGGVEADAAFRCGVNEVGG